MAARWRAAVGGSGEALESERRQAIDERDVREQQGPFGRFIKRLSFFFVMILNRESAALQRSAKSS